MFCTFIGDCCPLKKYLLILFCFIACYMRPTPGNSQGMGPAIQIEFLGETISLPYNPEHFVDFAAPLSQNAIAGFYEKIEGEPFAPIVEQLLIYKKQYKLDDWLYYQLIRKTAQAISPKLANYERYTLYKWFLLTRSGYDAILTIDGKRILFYVQCDENIYNIPSRIRAGKQYVCLNYHDYGSIDFQTSRFNEILLPIDSSAKGFSYKVRQIPDFKPGDYQERKVEFTYYQQNYQFHIKLNPQMKSLFNNYPVVDYESYFNIPLSKETYSSLIPALRENIKSMNVKNGVDYLMHFTRNAFSFEADSEVFGNEKRLSPEQTLLYEKSDCEDRAALFFYLVKEIYNLPMIVLAFPQHVTVAVKFDKPVGKSILYNGVEYSVCEPTPQKQDLSIGQLSPKLKNKSFEVAYSYNPHQN